MKGNGERGKIAHEHTNEGGKVKRYGGGSTMDKCFFLRDNNLIRLYNWNTLSHLLGDDQHETIFV